MVSNATPTTITGGNKLRVLLFPIFTTSHIQPNTELALCLAAANDAVEVTIAMTPANVPIVESLLLDRGDSAAVKITTYPFPAVEGLPEGVENTAKAATPEDTTRIIAAMSLAGAAHETLIRTHSPDAIITEQVFSWNKGIAQELGVPCVAFHVIGAFPWLVMRHLAGNMGSADAIVEVPGFPTPRILIPRTELPEFLKVKQEHTSITACKNLVASLEAGYFGLSINTSSELEKEYCEIYMREGYVKRAYFLGPVALGSPSSSSSSPASDSDNHIMDWLDSKPDHSVVYISFGTTAHLKDDQLDEIALGLETSGNSFLWVVRGNEEWTPPEGWEQRIQHRGLIARVFAPQKAVLGHAAVGAFVTQCGWNSILEAVAAGVPVLTWPMLAEQFITERLVTHVLGVGERLWRDGAGIRSTSYEEHELVPAKDVARALTAFMLPGGAGHAARIKVKDLAAKLHTAVAQGGSSHHDMHRLVHDLMAAKLGGLAL